MYTGPKFYGKGVHWGVSTTGVSGYGSLVLNSTDQTMEGDIETAQDPDGYVVIDATYNHRESATLETWVSSSSTNVGNAPVTIALLPQPGDVITIVDSVNTVMSGSNWIAGNASIRRSNTSIAKVSIPLRRYAKIT